MDDTGTRQEFPGGGMRDTAEGKPRFELLWTDAQPYEDQMLTRAARWMARGAEKYDSRNWELFDSPEALEHAKASLLRHTFKLLAGETDEDHAAAVWFNSQVIEYVRWKFRKASAEILAEVKPAPRYWKGVAGMTHYFRLDGEVFTFASESRSGHHTGHSKAAYADVEGMYRDVWDSLEEIPVEDVPEWAR